MSPACRVCASLVSADLDGIFPVDAPVREIHDRQSSIFAAAGAVVAEDAPRFPRRRVFRTLRAWRFQIDLGDRADATPELLKASLLDNIRQADRLSGPTTSRKPQVRRRRSSSGSSSSSTHHDMLVMPVSQVLPFDAELEYPAAVDGRRCDDYLDWMTSALP